MQANTQKTKRLVESALMLAVATVFSVLPLAKMPYGGSVTLGSMLPILLIAYRHGTPWGLLCGVAYGAIQQLLGLSELAYFTTWQSIVAVIFLDYIIAFAVIGLGGVFRGLRVRQSTALLLGALLASLARYACHVLSGATVWAGLSIPTEAALGYSFIYNATYMVPETVVLLVLAFYLGSLLDFRSAEIRRMASVAAPSHASNLLLVGAGLLAVGATVFDTVAVFFHMQDPESGEFNLSLLQTDSFVGSFWLAVVIVSAACALGALAMLLVRRHVRKKMA